MPATKKKLPTTLRRGKAPCRGTPLQRCREIKPRVDLDLPESPIEHIRGAIVVCPGHALVFEDSTGASASGKFALWWETKKRAWGVDTTDIQRDDGKALTARQKTWLGERVLAAVGSDPSWAVEGADALEAIVRRTIEATLNQLQSEYIEAQTNAIAAGSDALTRIDEGGGKR